MAKNFIESRIINYYYINNNENNDDNNNNSDNNEFQNILSLFKNDFATSTVHLLSQLKVEIINVFTPNDSHILNYFQTIIYNYFREKSNHIDNNKSKSNIKLDLLGKLLLDYNIKDAHIKIRNICFLIDIIIQKYFKIQYVPELDLLKFPRINIVINRLFEEKIVFNEEDNNEIINAIFEHFIISQFINNYLKYQVKDPEHYPLEIRYFAIYSYIKYPKI